MHGLIHIELERYAISALGAETWQRAIARSGLDGKIYSPAKRYKDEDLVALLVALATETELGPQALLERFGEALVPTLVGTYGYLIPPQWRTLDLVENTEEVIHVALRADDPAARPPLLRTLRRSPNEVVVIYASPRQMCGLAKGIVHGVASHFGEDVEITDEACMLAGDAACVLAIRGSASAP